MGKVLGICVSEKRGTQKKEVNEAVLKENWGIEGDAHAGDWHRQVSLLPAEAVDKLRDRLPDLAPGDFAENILTRGIDLKALPVGTVLRAGAAELVVTQIGKECHTACEIRRLTGRCAMPTEGIFCVVTRGGTVRAGDSLEVVAR